MCDKSCLLLNFNHAEDQLILVANLRKDPDLLQRSRQLVDGVLYGGVVVKAAIEPTSVSIQIQL